ncbi:MAG: NADH-quinone oxidoreductase subunit M, partial [Anaerolineae bacterium]
MNQFGFPLLSIVIFVPFVGAVVALFLGKNRTAVKIWALVVTVTDLILTALLWGFFDYGRAGLQYVDQIAWIESLGISYH